MWWIYYPVIHEYSALPFSIGRLYCFYIGAAGLMTDSSRATAMNPDGQSTAASVENLLFTCWAKLTVMQQTALHAVKPFFFFIPLFWQISRYSVHRTTLARTWGISMCFVYWMYCISFQPLCMLHVQYTTSVEIRFQSYSRVNLAPACRISAHTPTVF